MLSNAPTLMSRFGWFVLWLLGVVLPALANEPAESVFRPPVIDGVVQDGEWLGAHVFSNFHMMIPRIQEKNYDSTVVYIGQTSEALYFAFRYYPKGNVISKSLVRDRSTEEENEFFILLDLENRQQNGYIFAFSFIDNQRDMLVYNQRNQSHEWDWIWENRSTIYREAKDGKPGYIETEVKIPVDKIQNKNSGTIGVDVQMFAYRPDGTYYYYSLLPDSELLSLKRLYQLPLSTPFDERLNIHANALPFVVARKFNDSTFAADFGGDLNASLDRHKLKATYNTDESTLEADPFKFSFYNRPIFLQEKRTFFSKDLDIFRTPINLFYTRAIENIRYGVNYTFRSDLLKAGAVVVQDENVSDGGRRTFVIARPNGTFGNTSVGSLLIYERTPDGSGRSIGSVDASYRFPHNPLFFSGQYAVSGSSPAYEGTAVYQSNDAGGPFGSARYRRIAQGFESSTSFNQQIGVPDDYDEAGAELGYKWIADREFFSSMALTGGYYKARRVSDNFVYQDNITLSLYNKATGWMSFNHYAEYNRPNDISESGEVVAYDNIIQDHSVKFLVGSNALNVGCFFGSYFGSHVTNPYISADLFFFDALGVNLSYSYRRLFDIKQSVLNVRLDYRIIKDLYLRTFYQRDTYSRQSLLNAMIQYEFFAGSNAYIVLNLDGDRLQYTRRYFKISYEFSR